MHAGVAVSQDGIHWERGSQNSASIRPQNEAGKVLGPNEDWWWHDTRHTSVGDVQVNLFLKPPQKKLKAWLQSKI